MSYLSRSHGPATTDTWDQYDVQACVANDLTQSEMERCLRIIEAGTAVNPDAARKELPLVQVMVIARSGDEIVAIGVIKRTRPRYASSIARSSEFQFSRQTAELGHVAVDIKHRGNHLSHAILAKLLTNFEAPLFATTDSDYMKRSLRQAGFKKRGKEWKGRRGALSLWLKQKPPRVRNLDD